MRLNMTYSLFVVLILAGCSIGDTRSVKIRESQYTFRRENVKSITPLSADLKYIVIYPNDKRFKLIYSSISEVTKYKKIDVYVVNLIEETPSRQTSFRRVDGVDTVCQKLKIGIEQCGFTISDHGVRWSVLLKQNDLSLVKDIRARALAFLNESRGA